MLGLPSLWVVGWNLGFVHAGQADLAKQTLNHPKHILKQSFLWAQLEDFQVDWLGGVAGAGIMPIYVGVIVGFQVLPSSSLLLFPTQNPSIFG